MRRRKRNHSRHGMRWHNMYQVHSGMMDRCYNPKNECFHRYGGRGIKVCEEWHDVESFISTCPPRLSEEYSLDRVNNDGDYSPENCRWATRIEQANNTSRNKFIAYRGEVKTMADWARKFGINRTTLKIRLRRGWDFEEAIIVPTGNKNGFRP